MVIVVIGTSESDGGIMAGSLATRILAAGKSVNVLLVERLSQQDLSCILTEPRSVVAGFIAGMTRAAPPPEGWGVRLLEIDPQLRRTMLTDIDAVHMLEQYADEQQEEAASVASTRQAFQGGVREGIALSSSLSIPNSPGVHSMHIPYIYPMY